MRGEVSLNRRKRGEDGRSGKGGKVEKREQRRWKIFIKQKPKISKSSRKGVFVGITAKNENIAKAGDFRLFAARGGAFCVQESFVS